MQHTSEMLRQVKSCAAAAAAATAPHSHCDLRSHPSRSSCRSAASAQLTVGEWQPRRGRLLASATSVHSLATIPFRWLSFRARECDRSQAATRHLHPLYRNTNHHQPCRPTNTHLSLSPVSGPLCYPPCLVTILHVALTFPFTS